MIQHTLTLMAAGLCLAGLALAQEPAKKPADSPPAPRELPEEARPFDKNGDGRLDDAERKAMAEARREAAEARRKEVLERFDSNKDGKLDEAERKAAREAFEKERGDGARRRGPGGQRGGEDAAKRREALKKQFDKNGDGTLDEAEAKALREHLAKEREARREGGEGAPPEGRRRGGEGPAGRGPRGKGPGKGPGQSPKGRDAGGDA